MRLLKLFKIGLLITLIPAINAGPNQSWTYDILEISQSSTNNDWIELEYSVERISRGKYGFTGLFDLKTDLYDDTRFSFHLERSKFKAGPYTKMPMSLDNITLSDGMNTFYKDVIMPWSQDCAENAPYFEEKFVAPLTKRRVVQNKCEFKTENLPSVLMEGYYKAIFGLYGPADSMSVVALVYVENT